MRFTKEKKEIILSYLLEKIAEGREDIPHRVAEEFGINLNTVHLYITELIEQGKIRRVKRGEYQLISDRHEFHFTRNDEAMEDDLLILGEYVAPLVDEYPENVCRIWDYAFSEMVNNVIDHSEAENMYITILQNVRETSIIIRDDGIGLFQKLKEHYGFRSFSDIAAELAKGKLTTDDQNHSGEGLFFTSRLMDTFFVYSDGHYYSRDKYNTEWESFVPQGEMKGTLVFLSLENNSKREAREVFDAFTDEDGGFERTEIRFSSVFEKSPVSRSQAKRLCNRLEEFEEAVFDFSDVSWVGQGFMHQVFVVFHNQHPEIRLIPVNMNPDVIVMLRHVNPGFAKEVTGQGGSN